MSDNFSELYAVETPNLLFDFIDSCPLALRDLIPEGEQWSLHMLLRHVVDAEMQSYVRFMGMLAEAGSMMQNHDEEKWTLLHRRLTVAEARVAANFVRTQVCQLMQSYSKEVLQAAYALHSVRGKESFVDLLKMYEGHIHTHLAQARRIYAACAQS